MAYNGFAIDEYLDAEAVTRQLDELKKKLENLDKKLGGKKK